MADLEHPIDILHRYTDGEDHGLSGSASYPKQSPCEFYLGPYHSAEYPDFGPQYEDYEEGTENLTKPQLTKEQVDILETQFQAHPKPNGIAKRQLATQTKLTLPRVANWFQNRRAQAKQQKKQEEFKVNESLGSPQEDWQSGNSPLDRPAQTSQTEEFTLVRRETSPIDNIPPLPQRSDSGESAWLAARRKRPRPAALGSASVRSRSYGALSSMLPNVQANPQVPGPHAVRHVKPTGHSLNAMFAGNRRPSSAQLSPTNATSFPEAVAFEPLMAQQTLRERSFDGIGNNMAFMSPDVADNNCAGHDPSPLKGGVSASSDWSNVRSSMPWSAALPLIEPSYFDFGWGPLQEEASWTYAAGDAIAGSRSLQLTQLSSVALDKKVRSRRSFESISASLGGICSGKDSSSSSTDLPEVDSEGELSFIHSADAERAISTVEQVLFDATWKTLAFRVLREFSSNSLRTRPTASESPEQNTDSKGHGTSSGSRSTSSLAHTSAGKRPADSQQDSGDADDQEDAKKPRKQYRVAPMHEISDSLLACPYFKMNPVRYSERNVQEQCYRGCASSLLRDISRLKQHLYRVHRRPEYYCSSCYSIFETQNILDAHNRQRPSCAVSEPQFQEKMDKDQMTAIKRRNRRVDTHAEWYSIFKILFPTADLPASPYADQGSNEAVHNFVSFFQEEAPGILRDLIRCNLDGRVFLDQQTSNILDESCEYAVSQLVLRLKPSLDGLSFLAPLGQPVSLWNDLSNQSEPVNEAGSTIQSLQALETSTDPHDFVFDIATDAWPDLNYFD